MAALDIISLAHLVFGSPSAPSRGRTGDAPHESSGDHTREEIVEVLRKKPGLNQTELTTLLRHGWGTIQYHLRRLMRLSKVTDVMVGRERRYFAGQSEPLRMKRIAVLRKGRIKLVAAQVLRDPGLVQHVLSERAEITRKILRSYIDLLSDAGLIREEAAPAMKRYYPTDALRDILTHEVPVEIEPRPLSAEDLSEGSTAPLQ